MSVTQRRRFPRVYSTFLRQGEPTPMREAREAANPYTRPHLRDAFNSGWWGWPINKKLGRDLGNPLMTEVASAAYRKGHYAREAHEQHNQQEV